MSAAVHPRVHHPRQSRGGAEVTTIEGLDPRVLIRCSRRGSLYKCRNAATANPDKSCRPRALLKDFPTPSDQDIDAVMAGNLCRCMTYVRIRAAIKRAAANSWGAQDMTRLASLIESRPSALPSRLPHRPGGRGRLRIRHAQAARAAAYRRRASSSRLWDTIDPDGIVTVNIIRAEMGQHVGTAWRASSPMSSRPMGQGAHRTRRHRSQVGPDGHRRQLVGVADFPIFSRAGAAGRIALIEAGAKLLGESGAVLGEKRRGAGDGRSVSYGEIAPAPAICAGSRPRNSTSCRSSRSERRLIGRHAALDIAAKTNGAACYGIDAKVGGMVYARPKLPPTRNGSSVAVDDERRKQSKGVIRSSRLMIHPIRCRAG